MPYKIPSLPSAKAYKEETADFWEIQAVRNPGNYVSQVEISKIIANELDEINHEGIESEGDLLDDSLDDVFIEMQNRIKFTNDDYPFSFKIYSIKFSEEESLKRNVYLFLLLSTRLNMNTQKLQNNIDGTLLFEKLCANVAFNFFGDNSISYVFGTADPGNFETKVRKMIKNIGEGETFKNPNKNSPTKKDDSVDIVVWKEFSDKRIGKLIGFGQCKTGTSWKNEIHRLKPNEFCNNWFHLQPILNPIPIIFICDTLNEDLNFYTSQKGFLVFNRFRILEFVDNNLKKEVLEELNQWIKGALKTIDIQA